LLLEESCCIPYQPDQDRGGCPENLFTPIDCFGAGPNPSCNFYYNRAGPGACSPCDSGTCTLSPYTNPNTPI
jgi:hypothetical protein